MCIFGNQKTPQVSPPPPIVDTTDTSNAAYVTANQAAKTKAALAQGQDSTILTGPLGDTSTPNTTAGALYGS